jgi:Ca2+-binding RTX toxin-like protein
LAALIALGAAAPAPAADFTVTNLSDAGAGSLRQALADSGPTPEADRVLFAKGLSGTITLTSAELNIPSAIEIVGPGADRLTISGNKQFRVLHTSVSAPVTVSGLTLANGSTGVGGAGVTSLGPLVLSRMVIRDNNSTGSGGGVATSDALTVRDSTISGNTVGFQGGGLSVTMGPVTIERSTISGNTATMGMGGGIVHNMGSAGPMTITDSTIAGNTAGMSGGGIQFNSAGRLVNTIVADNTAPSRPDIDVFDMVTPDVRGDYSLVETPGGAPLQLDASNIVGVDPKLAPLASNGGPTPTLALLGASPALDMGNSPAGADQRGATRPFNLKGKGPAVGGDSSDIGAYERALCGKVLVNVVGTSGKDKLTGTKGKDGILGLGGKDTIKGKKGNDGLCGGAGKDTLRGGPGKDTLLGGGGKDLLVGGGGKDKLKGGGGKDRERP